MPHVKLHQTDLDYIILSFRMPKLRKNLMDCNDIVSVEMGTLTSANASDELAYASADSLCMVLSVLWLLPHFLFRIPEVSCCSVLASSQENCK